MEEIVTSIVLNSSSINSIFISTVDHLPCDVIRSLWLIQTCNTNVNKLRAKIHELLLKLQSSEQKETERSEIGYQIYKIKEDIKTYSAEATQEAKALLNQLITHKIILRDELQELRTLALTTKDSINGQTEAANSNELRERLKEHYEKHPLTSQREALKEQKSKEKKSKKHTKNETTGLKLVLKIPPKIKQDLAKNKVTKKKPRASDKRQTSTHIKPSKTAIEPVPVNHDIYEEDNQLYCFCHQPSFGDMIGCDNEESCPNGEWFHYKCVGILNRVDALRYTTGKEKWFCSDYCRRVVMGNKKSMDTRSPTKGKKKLNKKKRKAR